MAKRRRSRGKRELADLQRQILEEVAKGSSELHIIEALKLEPNEFKQLLIKAMNSLAEQLQSKPTEEYYAEYFIRGKNYMSQLNSLLEQESGMAPRDKINAIKAQFDISKDLLNTARELRIIGNNLENAGSNTQIFIGGQPMDVSKLASADLQKIIYSVASDSKQLDENFEEKHFLTIEDKKLHFGQSIHELDERPQEDAEEEKTIN